MVDRLNDDFPFDGLPPAGPMTDAELDDLLAAEKRVMAELMAWMDEEPARMAALLDDLKAADAGFDAWLAELVADTDAKLAELVDAIDRDARELVHQFEAVDAGDDAARVAAMQAADDALLAELLEGLTRGDAGFVVLLDARTPD